MLGGPAGSTGASVATVVVDGTAAVVVVAMTVVVVTVVGGATVVDVTDVEVGCVTETVGSAGSEPTGLPWPHADGPASSNTISSERRTAAGSAQRAHSHTLLDDRAPRHSRDVTSECLTTTPPGRPTSFPPCLTVNLTF